MTSPVWNKIVVHHSATPDNRTLLDFDSIKKYHVETRKWLDIGYHYVVEMVGNSNSARVVMGRPLHMIGAHCVGHNSSGIGVCFVGNFEESEPADAMIVEGARLIAGLIHALNLDEKPLPVMPHKMLDNTRCPGKRFPLGRLLNQINSELKGR